MENALLNTTCHRCNEKPGTPGLDYFRCGCSEGWLPDLIYLVDEIGELTKKIESATSKGQITLIGRERRGLKELLKTEEKLVNKSQKTK